MEVIVNFCDQLNKYIKEFECSSRDLVNSSGLSSSVISRYRKGERTPFIRSKQIQQLVDGLYKIGMCKKIDLKKDDIYNSFSYALNDVSLDFKQLSKNFRDILLALDINVADVSRSINYDASLLSRIRTGSRNPSKPKTFIDAVCKFIVTKYKSETDKQSVANLLGCSINDLKDNSDYFEKLSTWFSSHSE